MDVDMGKLLGAMATDLGELTISDPEITIIRQKHMYAVGYSVPLDKCPQVVDDFIVLYRFAFRDEMTRCVPLEKDSEEEPDVVIGVVLSRFDPETREYMLEVKKRHKGDSDPTGQTMGLFSSFTEHDLKGFHTHKGGVLLLSVDDITCVINDDVLSIDMTMSAYQ